MKGGKSTCICMLFCIIFFSSPFVILITLDYVGLKPRFYIQEIYIPSLNNTNSPTFKATNLNTSIFIDLKFKRVMAFVPIRYEDVKITIFDASNTSSAVGSAVVPRFGQGKKKAVHQKAVLEAPLLAWEDAFRKISGGSTVALVVEMATKYSLKRCSEDNGCYYTKPKAAGGAAEVRLDGSGQMVSKKPIRLR